MACLNPDSEKSGGLISEDAIQRAIDQLEDEMQKDFIRRCLRRNPVERPTARELLFHPVLFEVHSLKLLAAHTLVNGSGSSGEESSNSINETMTDEAIQSHYGLDSIMATVTKGGKATDFKLADVPVAEKLEKFMEDVKNGIYPITAFALAQPAPSKTRAVSPEGPVPGAKSEGKQDEDSEDEMECRRIVQVLCSLGFTSEPDVFNCIIIARLEDAINRQLTALVTPDDGPDILVDELIEHKFVSPLDRGFLMGALADVYRKLAVHSARRLREEAARPVPPGPDTEPEAAVNGGVESVNGERKRTRKEIDDLKNDSLFAKLKHYCTTDGEDTRNLDPEISAEMRDPTYVARKFPLPDGAFFEPPAAPDGSEPYRIPPPGTNAFDCSHLEAQAQQKASKNTPRTDSSAYDPYTNLQGAQKVLEGLQQQPQQPQQPQLQSTPQEQDITPVLVGENLEESNNAN